MKPLNHLEIIRAFNRFLVWFASLLLLLIGCVYSCVQTSSRQSSQLMQQKQAFDRVFFADAMLANSVDSLYNDMSLLNSDQIRDNREMQRRITRKKEALIKRVNQQQKTQRYFVVYNRMFGHINEMLLMKDSINKATVQEVDLKQELKECSDHYEQTREADRQRNQNRPF